MTAALALDQARDEFDRARCYPVDLNGEGPGFQALCPVCPKTLRAYLDEDDRVQFECPSGCSFSRIADELYFRSKAPEGFAEPVGSIEAVGHASVVESGAARVPDRYAGRRVDLHALLAQPPRPTPWRVRDVVADGTLTIISGESGSGKSWLAQALCTGVARGQAIAGLLCTKGPALYVDAEMGPQMFVDQRLRPTGVASPEFDYIDAMGLDVSKPGDLAWLQGEIEATAAKFVVIDSFRRLVPSKAENDSDDMAPAVAALAKLARDTDAAVMVIHHKGDSEKFFRGSSAIKDQCDALFALLRDPDDENAPRRLRCRGKGKMRYAPEPADVYLDISPETGGVDGSDPPESAGPVVSAREATATAIKAALPAKTKTEIADKVGRALNDNSFRGAWSDLEDAGEITKVSGHWELGSRHQTLGAGMTTYSDGGVA